MWPMMSYLWTFCSSWMGDYTCKVFPQFISPLQRRLLKVFFFLTKRLPNNITDDVINIFSVDNFIPRGPSKIFILIRRSILHMQLWCHNEGTYDVIKKSHIPHEEYLPCAKFQYFPWCGFRVRGSEFFSFSNMVAIPRDLWHHNYH